MRLIKRLVLLVGMLSLSIAVLPLQAQEPMSLVEMVPQDDVVIYAYANLDTLIPALEAIGQDSFFDEAFMSDFFGEGATVRTQLLSWMDDEIAFVYRFTEQDAMNGTIGQAMVIAPVADMDLARTTLDGVARNFVDGLPEEDVTLVEETITINGMDVQTYSVGVDLEGDSDIFFSMALWDGFAALGNSPAIQGMLDILEGKEVANLAANADYQATLDSFEIEHESHVYISPHGMRTVDNLAGVGLMIPRDLRIPADGTRGMGVALNIDNDVWQLEISSLLRDEAVLERFGDFPELQLETNTIASADSIPANALAAVMWGNLGDYVRYLTNDAPQLVGMFGSEGGDILEQLRGLSSQFGFNLDEDFLPRLGNPLGMFAIYNPESNARCLAGDSTAYDFGVVMPVNNPMATAELFTRLTERAAEFPLVEQRTLTLVDITTSVFETEPSLFAGLFSEAVVAGNSTAYDALITTLSGATPSLAETDQWQRATAYLPDDNSYPLVYVDVMQSKAVIEQLMAYDPNDTSSTFGELVERFETMLLTMNFDDNRVLLHVDLLTMPEGVTLSSVPPLTDALCN